MEDLKARLHAVFQILREIGPISFTDNVGPRLYVVHSSSSQEGVTLKGKFWHYYPHNNFHAQPLFLLTLEVEMQPDAGLDMLESAYRRLRSYRASIPQFTAEETQEVVRLIWSGEMADYLRG